MKNFIKASAALALAAATLASCQQNGSDFNLPGPGRQIRFGVSGIQKTKTVTEVTDATFEAPGASFNVASIATSDDSMYVYFNETVTLSETEFKTATSYYYPETGTLDFHAVHPVSQVLEFAADTVSTAFTVDGDTDLVVASAYDVAPSSSPVALVFKHALAQIKFEAKGADAQVEYTVDSVKIVSPASGVYKYCSAGDLWVPGKTDTTLYDASAATVYPAEVSTSELTAFGEAETYLPGQTGFEISWKCTKNGQIVASYKRSAELTLTRGKKTTVQLGLPNDEAAEISFTVTVEDWEEETQQIDMKKQS